MRWGKLDTNLYANPKIAVAGRDGTHVFLYALGVNLRFRCHGQIPRAHLEPEMLVYRIPWVRRLDTARKALDAAISAGLLTPKEGVFLVSGWDVNWAPTAHEFDADRTPTVHGVRNNSALRVQSTFPKGSENEQLQILETPLDKREEREERERSASAPPPPKKRAKRLTKNAALLARWQQQAAELWALQEDLRREAIPGSRSLRATDDRLAAIAGLLESGHTRDDCEAVLRRYADACQRPDQRQWFDGVSNWVPKNFSRTLGKVGSDDKQESQFMLFSQLEGAK